MRRLRAVFDDASRQGRTALQTIIGPAEEECLRARISATALYDMVAAAGPTSWRVGRHALRSFTGAPGIGEQLRLLPRGPRPDTKDPVEIAAMWKDVAGQLGEFTDASRKALKLAEKVLDDIGDLSFWFEHAANQMDIHSELTTGLERSRGPEDALGRGHEIWQWCRGEGAFARAEPLAFTRAVSLSRSEKADVAPGSVRHACAALADGLETARTASRAELEKILAAIDGPEATERDHTT